MEALCGLGSLQAQHPDDATSTVRWVLARGMKCQPEAPAFRAAVRVVASALGVAEAELVRRLQLLGHKVDLGGPSV